MVAGIALVDKPGGITSHDVVSRARRALNTRKVGHAGTLDPMATGLLVLGVGAATRLLTFFVGLDKTYRATIRLGGTTHTDDADGDILTTAKPGSLERVQTEQVLAEMAALTGEISQIPSAVSAIKVDGRRAYERVRAGEDVALTAREVTVSRFDLDGQQRLPDAIDLDVVVDCSSGTYVRALARDLGAALGVGGHLTALRRTRIGPFEVEDAVSVDDLSAADLIAPADAAAAVLGAVQLSDSEATDLRHGKRLPAAASRLSAPRMAAIDPTGALVGVVRAIGGDVATVMNMPEAQ